VTVKEHHDGTILWLRRETPNAKSKTHQRICMDTLTVSATVYWVDSQGNPSSKSFRKLLELREWLALDPVQ
jgi:hypothetical protein